MTPCLSLLFLLLHERERRKLVLLQHYLNISSQRQCQALCPQINVLAYPSPANLFPLFPLTPHFPFFLRPTQRHLRPPSSSFFPFPYSSPSSALHTCSLPLVSLSPAERTSPSSDKPSLSRGLYKRTRGSGEAGLALCGVPHSRREPLRQVGQRHRGELVWTSLWSFREGMRGCSLARHIEAVKGPLPKNADPWSRSDVAG